MFLCRDFFILVFSFFYISADRLDLDKVFHETGYQKAHEYIARVYHIARDWEGLEIEIKDANKDVFLTELWSNLLNHFYYVKQALRKNKVKVDDLAYLSGLQSFVLSLINKFTEVGSEEIFVASKIVLVETNRLVNSSI